MYRVETARSRIKNELRRIPKTDLTRIGEAILALGENPYPVGVVQLQKDIYRIRVGEYRIVYKVYEDELLVLIGRVVRRGENTYKDIGNLFP
jgi:mRNA interferase RelE/StbE